MFEHVAPVQVATGTPDSQMQVQNTKPNLGTMDVDDGLGGQQAARALY